MVKKKRYWGLFFILVFVGLVSGASRVSAGELDFTVTPIFPENQQNKALGYFDLRMKPNQKQFIEVEINNTSDRAITVEMHATTAVTNLNGVIEYKDLEPTLDTSLTYPFQTVAELPESVDLKGNETKKVTIELTMPEEEYNGMILGGLYFKEQGKKETELSDQKGMGVRNVFSYVVGVKLTETDLTFQPDLKLLEARGGQVNYHNAFEAQLQNPEAVEMNDLTVTAQVMKQGSSTILYEETREGLRMAPNSNFYYPVPLNGGAFQSGTYDMLVKAHTPEQEWELKTSFEITADQAKQINEASVEDIEYGPPYWLWISIGAGIILVVIVFGVLWYRYRVKQIREQLASQLNRHKGPIQGGNHKKQGAAATGTKKKSLKKDR
ncbi:DUF916 and DUF3324 domain-containing protein [Enterococcus sp. 5H]|uniref:DUF916 and DUF3324 domain-containing protein n=1 Tax=Enterococcus sp. 5H TaxID=1229490 RepID=UPI0023040C9A|nr:DUF916 and DUF3324 domain-containing protein [Enterococcus sp. 5H]MDA9470555.1 cell surface protein precursor [Enterococcus sp. 5H]